MIGLLQYGRNQIYTLENTVNRLDVGYLLALDCATNRG